MHPDQTASLVDCFYDSGHERHAMGRKKKVDCCVMPTGTRDRLTVLMMQLAWGAFRHNNPWRYTLSGLAQPPSILRYTRGCKTRPHVDYQPYEDDLSKMTLLVMLSKPTDYDGGDLIVNEGEPLRLGQGDAVIFPANALHEVTEVTRGERFVLAAWAAGPSLR